MNKSAYRAKNVVFLLPLLVFMLGCGLSGRPVSIKISEIGTCYDYDRASNKPIDITDEFPSDTDQITVYFYTETNLQAEVTYRWFFENELIAEYHAPLEQGYNFGWITPKDTWPEGEYKVEILLAEVTLRSTSFQVVSP